jgi:thymidylate synthase ThyX
MSYKVEILADSLPLTLSGERLTTMALTFPRIILAEVNTHRSHARNCESSRAIPVHKKIQRVVDDPFIPEFTSEQGGMQGGDELTIADMADAENVWLGAMQNAVAAARSLVRLGVHKQTANRLIEPFSWVTDILSATSAGWANFFYQRTSKLAQPEFKIIARMAYDAYDASRPRVLTAGDVHAPLIDEVTAAEIDGQREKLKRVSAARCARVSYLTHDGVRSIDADLELFERLISQGHWSPLEHVATPMTLSLKVNSGCFDGGWLQMRKEYEGEYVRFFYGYEDERTSEVVRESS